MATLPCSLRHLRPCGPCHDAGVVSEPTRESTLMLFRQGPSLRHPIVIHSDGVSNLLVVGIIGLRSCSGPPDRLSHPPIRRVRCGSSPRRTADPLRPPAAPPRPGPPPRRVN